MFSLKQSVIIALALSTGMVNALTEEATWYTPNSGIGAYGAPLQNSDHIVALSQRPVRWRGTLLKAYRYKGKFVDATIEDLCPGCGHNVIDLSSSALQKLAPLDDGRIGITWN
ncbi:riboflavine-aldehyde-forming enzyme [Desarmillaria tabescens]|uniref:Riboflavine-aldehyde-forming enzyme n=1 Tax=Armillaria tabescens TaxID=1929756 RepID=A0AA39N4P5_ARMTA|nr:riboflavine-aldehyde-forming enzyme [Desarmillaria tabescens]KAK0457324.1 riboflavine-aldehyde-forming enzyme [Desarmillaria tabescens]